MSTDAVRPLRADAQLNHDRLLEVAAVAFLRDGDAATMRGIAKEAGVGVGTLYRRFPTREQLVEATYRSEVDRLRASASELLLTHNGAQSLRIWMHLFVEFLATKEGMGDALRSILTDESDRMNTRYLLADAIQILLTAGAAEGELRDDVSAYDVLLAIGGMAVISGDASDSELVGRLLELVFAGLTARSD